MREDRIRRTIDELSVLLSFNAPRHQPFQSNGLLPYPVCVLFRRQTIVLRKEHGDEV
jgi:hypothetical protein